MHKPDRAKLPAVVALLLLWGVRLLVCHGGGRESALLLRRGGVVRRFQYRAPEEQAPAVVAAAVGGCRINPVCPARLTQFWYAAEFH